MSEPPDLRSLRYFVIVVEERSITRAAIRLHISQQSLSARIHQLESRIGAPLLDRSSRGVTPTRVGRVLLREAVPLLGSAERAMELVASSARGVDAELRVGFLSSLANEVMPPVIALFAERHPATRLQTADLPIATIVEQVRAGTLDAAISRPPLIDDLHGELLGSEGVVIALPAQHRLARRRRLRLAELADEPWVMTPRSSWPPWHRLYDADFAAAGFRPRIERRSTTPQGLLALVAAGVGVTRLASSARSLRSGGVRFVPLTDERAAVVLLTRPGSHHPALADFRIVVLEALVSSMAGFTAAPSAAEPVSESGRLGPARPVTG